MIDWLKGILGIKRSRKQELINTDIIREILNKVEDSSLVVSTRGDILFANAHFLRLFGLAGEGELPSKVYDPAIGLTTKEKFREEVDVVRRHSGKIVYERELKHETGHRHVQISIVMYKLNGEEHMWYFSKDITELREQQAQLRELNQMLNAIIDNLPVYLFVKDVDNELRYVHWNKAFERYSKIPASKVIGHTDFEVFPDYKDALMFHEDDMHVVNTGKRIEKHETYLAADGESHLVKTVKALVEREGKGPLLIGVSMDMNNLKSIEQELIQERLRAEESDRLKSRFLANMSHEIRTPLNAIVGFAGLLADADDEESRHDYADIINQNSEILLRLINDILDISKIEAGTLEYTRQPMDLIETCRNIYLVHKDRMHPSVKLIFDNEDTTGHFVINEDRNRIAQVIDNLLTNAIKFTNKGEVRLGFGVQGDWLSVYVKDTGIGIPKDKHQEIFTSFVKLDPFAQGTGLGLPICKLIAETLGGKITLESEPGEGSTFKFTIPYKKKRSEEETSEDDYAAMLAGAAQDATGKGNRTILVVEDVTSNYLVIKAMAKNRDNLIWARNGIEAIEMAEKEHPDLIFMDIKMPQMNGLDAARQIRNFDTHVPIVALTANAFDNDRMQALNAGMDDFLPKPVNRAAFDEMLSKYL